MSRAPKVRPRPGASGFDIEAAMFAVVLEDEAAKEDSPGCHEWPKMADSIRMKGSAMLKLIDVPNNVDDSDFGGAPNMADASATTYIGTTCYVIWPAQAGDRRIQVLVNLTGFSDAVEPSIGQNPLKVGGALKKHRDLIERRANETWDKKSEKVSIY